MKLPIEIPKYCLCKSIVKDKDSEDIESIKYNVCEVIDFSVEHVMCKIFVLGTRIETWVDIAALIFIEDSDIDSIIENEITFEQYGE